MTVSQRACKIWSYYGKVLNQQQLQEWLVGVYFLLLEQMGTAQSQHLPGAVWIHSHTCLQGFALQTLSAQAIQHISLLPWKVQKCLCQLSQLPAPLCKLLLACSQLHPASQHLANLSHITSPFTSHFSAHIKGPEHFTCSSPRISLLRCLLT